MKIGAGWWLVCPPIVRAVSVVLEQQSLVLSQKQAFKGNITDIIGRWFSVGIDRVWTSWTLRELILRYACWSVPSRMDLAQADRWRGA